MKNSWDVLESDKFQIVYRRWVVRRLNTDRRQCESKSLNGSSKAIIFIRNPTELVVIPDTPSIGGPFHIHYGEIAREVRRQLKTRIVCCCCAKR